MHGQVHTLCTCTCACTHCECPNPSFSRRHGGGGAPSLSLKRRIAQIIWTETSFVAMEPHNKLSPNSRIYGNYVLINELHETLSCFHPMLVLFHFYLFHIFCFSFAFCCLWFVGFNVLHRKAANDDLLCLLGMLSACNCYAATTFGRTLHMDFAPNLISLRLNFLR